VVASLGVPSGTYEGDGRRLPQHEFARPSSASAILPGVGLGLRLEEWELVPPGRLLWRSRYYLLARAREL
jgi:hypothetical protein